MNIVESGVEEENGGARDVQDLGRREEARGSLLNVAVSLNQLFDLSSTWGNDDFSVSKIRIVVEQIPGSPA